MGGALAPPSGASSREFLWTRKDSTVPSIPRCSELILIDGAVRNRTGVSSGVSTVGIYIPSHREAKTCQPHVSQKPLKNVVLTNEPSSFLSPPLVFLARGELRSSINNSLLETNHLLSPLSL